MKSLLDIVVEYSIKNRNDVFSEYMASRRWSESTINNWKLGFFSAPNILSLIADIRGEKMDVFDLEKKFICKKIGFNYKSFLFGRIIFPIYDPHGGAIAISGRVLDDSKPKYFNTAFQKGKTLFGLNLTKKSIIEKRRAYVFEGYADVISAFQNGICNVTCCMGTTLTEDHYILLSRYAEDIVLFFDNDKAGMEALKRFNEKKLDETKKDTKIFRCFLNEEKDVDEFLQKKGPEEFEKYVNDCIADLELQKKLKNV
jgi:DNA primase